MKIPNKIIIHSATLLFLFIYFCIYLLGTAYAGKHLVVGVYDNSPLVYKDENGTYKGLSVEILEAVAQKRGWTLEYNYGTWPQCLERLETGVNDLQIIIGYTEKRDEVYDYSKEALFVAWGRVYSNKTSKIDNILELEGKRVALYKGSLLSSAFISLVKKFDINIEIVEVEDYEASIAAMKENRADASVLNRTFIDQYAGRDEFHKTSIIFSPTPIFYASPANKHEDVLQAIDKDLIEFKADNNSLYYQLIEKFFGKHEKEVIPSWVKLVLLILGILICCIGLVSILLRGVVKKQTHLLRHKNQLLEQEVESRRKAEKALTLWGEVFRIAKWGIGLGSIEGLFTQINPAYAEMHGYSVKELVELPIKVVFTPEYQEKLPQIISTCHKLGHYSFEADHVRKDGTVFPVYHDVTTAKDENGDVLYRIVNILDISDRVKAEKIRKDLENELRQAQKMEAIGTLAGGIAHDFNNILTAILGFAELIEGSCGDDNEELKNDINEIIVAGKRAKELVSHILIFSRKSDKNFSHIRFNKIVEEAMVLIRASIPTTVKIIKNTDLDCGELLGNATQIHQVLVNLCTNASQAMEETGGELTIDLGLIEMVSPELQKETLLKQGRYIRLSVQDTGEGIDQASLPRIFEPYFTTKEVGKGSGIGLSVVHGIVKGHGGAITVVSNLGKGTLFNVYLPSVSVSATI